MEQRQISVIQLAWSGNVVSMKAQYAEYIAQAVKEGGQIICLQEFSLAPYFASFRNNDGFQWSEPLHGGVTDKFFGALAKEHGVTIISSLFEKESDDQYYDTAIIHNPQGELAHYTRKVHIPSGTGYHESDYFDGYTDFPVHDVDTIKTSVPTCYDQWFPEVARISALNGAEFIFYPTAIGSEPSAPDFDSRDAWQIVMRGHAVANGVYIAAANRIGAEEIVTFYGSSFVCDPLGNIIAQASRDQAEIIHAELKPSVRQQYQELFPLLHQRRPQVYGRILESTATDAPENWDAFKSSREE